MFSATELATEFHFDPHDAAIDRIIAAWVPLTFAVNSINRSMGQADLYPFVLTPQVIWKLGFVHDRIHAVGSSHPNLSQNNELRAIIALLKRSVGSPRHPRLDSAPAEFGCNLDENLGSPFRNAIGNSRFST